MRCMGMESFWVLLVSGFEFNRKDIVALPIIQSMLQINQRAVLIAANYEMEASVGPRGWKYGEYYVCTDYLLLNDSLYQRNIGQPTKRQSSEVKAANSAMART